MSRGIFARLHLLCLFVVFESSSARVVVLDRKLIHGVISGQGLYNGFTEIAELDSGTFEPTVYGDEKNKLWLVEFYNSWCGDCQRYAPTWMALAADVYEWRNVVRIGAIDCANDANNRLCRDHEVERYPTVRLFTPNSDEKILVEDTRNGTVEVLRKLIINRLKSHQEIEKNAEAVNLKPLNSEDLENFWSGVPPYVKFIVLIIEEKDSLIGSEVALDLSRTKELRVHLVNPDNKYLNQIAKIEKGSKGAIVFQPGPKCTDLHVEEHSRGGLNNAIRQYLVKNGVNVSLHLPSREILIASENTTKDILQMEEEIKHKLHVSSLSVINFQADLEGAIRYSLKNEVPLRKKISGEHFRALKNYMSILIKFLPFGNRVLDFLKKINQNELEGKNEVSGKSFRETFLRLEQEHNPFSAKQGWIGCRGSKSQYRGYPCSLWSMFHTLTVGEANINNTDDSRPEVLYAMADYIKHFFTCSNCAEHFGEMAETMAGNITTTDDSVLWLWAAHNRVNSRLAGDKTEDPIHQKIQFPNVEACPTCRTSDGSWNKTEVLMFLKQMYSNIVNLQQGEGNL